MRCRFAELDVGQEILKSDLYGCNMYLFRISTHVFETLHLKKTFIIKQCCGDKISFGITHLKRIQLSVYRLLGSVA